MGSRSAAKIFMLLFLANQKCYAGPTDRMIISNVLSSQLLQTSSNAINYIPEVQLQPMLYDHPNLPLQNFNLMLQNHHNEEDCSLSTAKVSALDIDTSVSLSTGNVIPQILCLGALAPVHISSQNSVLSVSSTPTSSSSLNSFSHSQAPTKSLFPSTSDPSNIPVLQNLGCINDVHISEHAKNCVDQDFIISSISNNGQDILSSSTVCSNSNVLLPQSLNHHIPVISNPLLPVLAIIESNNLANIAKPLKISPKYQDIQSATVVSSPLFNMPIQDYNIEPNCHAKNREPLIMPKTYVNVQPTPPSPIFSLHDKPVSQILPYSSYDPSLFISSNDCMSKYPNAPEIKNNIQNSNLSNLDQCDKSLQSKKPFQLNGKPVPSTTNILTLNPISNLKPVYPQTINSVPRIPDIVKTSLPNTFIDPACSIFTCSPSVESNMDNPIVSFDDTTRISLLNNDFTEDIIIPEIQDHVNLLNIKTNYLSMSDCNLKNKVVLPRNFPANIVQTNVGATYISPNSVCNSVVEPKVPNPNIAYNNIVNMSPTNANLNESPVGFDKILKPTDILQAINLQNTKSSVRSNSFPDYNIKCATVPPTNIDTNIDIKSSIGATSFESNNACNPTAESKISSPTVSFSNIVYTFPCTSNVNINNLDKVTENLQKENILNSLPHVLTSTAPNINVKNTHVVDANIKNSLLHTQSNVNVRNTHVPVDIGASIEQLPTTSLISIAPNNKNVKQNVIISTVPEIDLNKVVCTSPSKSVTMLNPSIPTPVLSVSPINCAASGIVPVSSTILSEQRLQSNKNTIAPIYVPPCTVTAPSTSALPIYSVEPTSKSYVPSITYLKTQNSSPVSDCCSSLVSNLVESILSAVNPQTLLQSVLNPPPPLPAPSYPQSTYISSYNIPTYKHYTPQYIEIETEYYQDFIPNLDSRCPDVSVNFGDNSPIFLPVSTVLPTSRTSKSCPSSPDLTSIYFNDDDDESSSNARDLINMLLYNELLGQGCKSFNSMLTFLLANL